MLNWLNPRIAIKASLHLFEHLNSVSYEIQANKHILQLHYTQKMSI